MTIVQIQVNVIAGEYDSGAVIRKRQGQFALERLEDCDDLATKIREWWQQAVSEE